MSFAGTTCAFFSSTIGKSCSHFGIAEDVQELPEYAYASALFRPV